MTCSRVPFLNSALIFPETHTHTVDNDNMHRLCVDLRCTLTPDEHLWACSRIYWSQKCQKINITYDGVTIFTDLVNVALLAYSTVHQTPCRVCCLRDPTNETLSVFTVSGNQLCFQRALVPAKMMHSIWDPHKNMTLYTFVSGNRTWLVNQWDVSLDDEVVLGESVQPFTWPHTVKHLSVRCSSLQDSFHPWPQE